MFDEWHRRERFIRKTLRRLSRQRVVLILQPGNVWVVEKAVSEGEGQEVVAALRTCNLRGWVEIQSNAVPHAEPKNFQIVGVAPIYKLTEAGWNVIHRSHEWVVATFVVVAITLIATILSIFITNALIK
jgi:hypothetical protein